MIRTATTSIQGIGGKAVHAAYKARPGLHGYVLACTGRWVGFAHVWQAGDFSPLYGAHACKACQKGIGKGTILLDATAKA